MAEYRMLNPVNDSPLRQTVRGGALTEADRLRRDNANSPTALRAFQSTVLADQVGAQEMRLLKAQRDGNQDEMLRAQAEAERLNANREAVAPTGSQSFTEAQEAGDYGNYLQNVLGGGAGSMVKPLAGATVGQLVGGALRARRGAGALAGSTAGSYDMLSNMEALEASQDPEALALSPQDRLRMVRTSAAAQTLPEALLPTRLATGFRNTGPVGRVVSGAATEGATEAAQNLIDTGVESQFIDGRRPDWQAVRDDAIAGAIFGGGAAALAGGDAAPAPERTDGQPLEPEAITNNPITPIAPNTGPAEAMFTPTPEPESDRIPDSVEDPYAEAKQAGRDAFENIKSAATRMAEAASTAKTPQEFLKAALGDRLNTDLEPILLGPEDPSLAGETVEETVANIERRDAENVERTRTLAEQMLNDQSIPDSIRNRLFDMDYSDPANQRFVAETLQNRARTQRVSNAVNDVIKTAKDFTKGVTDAVKDARVKKSNLQSASPTEQAGFNKVIFDNLTDEAKANPTIRQKLPELAQALVAFASRTGDLTQKDLKTLTKLQGDLDGMFTNPDAVIKQLVAYAQVPQGSQSFVERMRQISNAQQDVRGSENSFLASSLTPEARESLGPEQITQLARLVDNFTVIDADPSEGDRILAGLDMAFGDRDTTRAVLDYYGQLNNIDLLEDAPEQVQEVDAAEAAENDLSEVDAPKPTYQFSDPKTKRPYRRFVASPTTEGGMRRRVREATSAGAALRGGSPDNIDVRAVGMDQYVKDAGGDAEAEVIRISDDIKKRIAGHKARKDEDRSQQINQLEGELALLRQEYRSGGADAALRLYEVLQVTEGEQNNLIATDEEIAKMGKIPNVKSAAPTRVTFERNDGSKMTLSAESMWKTQGDKEGSGRGENATVRAKRLFNSAVASVLARPEIKALSTPMADILIDRKLNIVAGRAPSNLQYQAKLRAALKQAEPSLTALRKTLKDVVDEYTETFDPNGDEGRRTSIEETIDANINQLEKRLRDARDGKGPLAQSAPAQAVGRRRLALYRDARTQVDAIRFDVEFTENDDNRPGMPGEAQEGPVGPNELIRTRSNEELANPGTRFAEEDTGLGVGVEPRKRVTKNSKMGTVTKPQQGIGVGEDATGDIDPMDDDSLPFNLREQAGYDPKTTPKENTKRIKKNTFVGALAYPFDAAQAKFHLTMNQSRAAAEKIFKESGWFKGPDGKVRKELDPRPVVEKVIESLNENVVEMTLGTFLAELDPTVAARYRNKIGGVRVNLAAVNSPELDGSAGHFNPGKQQILISPVHSVLADMSEKHFTGFMEYLNDGAGNMVYDDQSLFETLYEWGQETGTKLPDVYTATAKTFVHEMQHAIQLAEGFENGGSPELAAVVAYGDPKAYKKAALANDPEARGEVVNKAIQNMIKTFGPDADVKDIAQKLYKRITGEAEAYNVEDRINLTDAERREILPELMGNPDGFIRSMVNVIAGKMVNQSTMKGRKGRAGKLSEADRKAIIAEIRRLRGDKVRVTFEKFADIGGSGEFSMNPNKTDRLIRIAINSLNPMGVAWHESLHDFFNVIGGNKVENQMKKSLLESASSPYVMHRLRQLLKDHPDALEQIKTDKEERLAYMYQFWAEGELKVTPDGEGIFTRIAQFFRDLLGVVSQDQKTQAIFEAFHQGQFANPSITAAVMQDLKAQTLGEKLRDVSGPLAQWADAALVSAADRLRDTAVPAFEEIADLFMPGVGQERPGDSFIQKRSQTTHKYVNRLQAILEDTNATERRQALDHLQSMQPPRNKLEQDVKSILDDLHTYMVKAGVKRFDPKTQDWVDMGKVKNYFPRVFDREYLRTHKADWIKLLTPYVGVEQAYKTHEALLSGDGTLELNESEHHLGYTPFAKSVQNRQFTFIDETNAAEFAKFQEKDLTDTLTTYIQQATHRAEYARFFGNDGEIIQEKLKAAANQGATEEDINTASKSIRALEGTLGSDFNPRLRTLMSGIVAYQNFILLPLALFTNIVDPIGVAVRSGDITEAGKAFMYGMQGVVRGLKGEGLDSNEEMAKILGLINEEHILETMGDVYSSRYTPKSVKRLSNKFFKYNGLQMWDRRMRTAAMMTGQRFIIKNIDNKRYMDELGIEPSDVYVNADGTMAITKDQIADHLRLNHRRQRNGTYVARTAAQVEKQSEEIEARIHAGLYKFVDSAVVRPTAAQQPIWVSDPRFQLIAHFKQFTFSFHNTILKRVGHEWQNENATPAMLLLTYVPFMFAADVTRGLLTGTINPESFDFYDQLGRSIVRSGIMGTGTFGADVEGDVDRGNLPGLSLLGPAFDHLRVLLEFLTGDATFEKTALRSLPGGSAVRGFM